MLATPALNELVPATTAHAHPYDLDRLGVATGDVVRVVTSRGNFDLAVTTDPSVVRGTVEFALNTRAPGGLDVVAASVIDAGSAVTELRLESK